MEKRHMFIGRCQVWSLNLIIIKSVAWVRERTIPTEQPLLDGEVSAKFADKWCHVVSVTVPHGRIVDFLDRHGFRGN
jgi:hypothetical protein